MSGFPYLTKSLVFHSYLGSNKVELELCLLLQSEPLDGEERVGLGLADDDPPALFSLRGEVGGDDGACC